MVINMTWRTGYGKGSWHGGPWAWPGRGPWSYLPPWERPGWYYGRGWCWNYMDDKLWLENYRDFLRSELQYVEERLKELEGSTTTTKESSEK